MTEAAPRVALLILNWNGWRDTVECLESVFHSRYPADRLSVVVCDNGSTDGSVEKIQRWANGAEVPQLDSPAALRPLVDPPVAKPLRSVLYTREQLSRESPTPAPAPLTIIANESNLGFAGGNNVGITYLVGRTEFDYVCILNNDILLHPDAITEFVKACQAIGPNGAVGGTLYEYTAADTVQAVGGGRFRMWQGMSMPITALPRSSAAPRVDYLSGGFVFAPRKLLEATGPMPEEYFLYGEDVDYSFRMRDAGGTLTVSSEARGWHKGGSTVTHRSPRHDYYVVRNGLEIVRRHAPGLLPVCAVYMGLRCGLPKVARGQWTRLAVMWRAYQDFASGTLGRAPVLPGE